jgi:DNA-binding CsgD family transcriptional regulator
VARAVRRALLQAVCDSVQLEGPPGSLLLGSDGDLVVSSAAAEEQLAALDEPQVGSVLAALAGAVRARGAATMTATGPGGVVALHGSPAKGVDGAVAVVVERPRPVQLAPLVMRAVGFTAREREVAEALLQGATRRQIARRAGASEHTVGDHLRSLYRKAGVSGRAELAALLYDRHYATPRATGTPPSPYGYFVGMG